MPINRANETQKKKGLDTILLQKRNLETPRKISAYTSGLGKELLPNHYKIIVLFTLFSSFLFLITS